MVLVAQRRKNAATLDVLIGLFFDSTNQTKNTVDNSILFNSLVLEIPQNRVTLGYCCEKPMQTVDICKQYTAHTRYAV